MGRGKKARGDDEEVDHEPSERPRVTERQHQLEVSRLSGGLDADNVGAALSETGAGALDLSSGVESAPGVKDTGLIEEFFDAVREGKTASPARGVET